jgi:acetylornithine/succinyldiaminopimelate/putrescine aminotransferase
MDQEALLELARKHMIRYASAFAPFVVSRAEASWIWDQDGNKYLDFTSGQICYTIGRTTRGSPRLRFLLTALFRAGLEVRETAARAVP